jgi:hypothetical protein
MSFGMRCTLIRNNFTDVSEEQTTYIFRIEDKSSRFSTLNTLCFLHAYLYGSVLKSPFLKYDYTTYFCSLGFFLLEQWFSNYFGTLLPVSPAQPYKKHSSE